MSDDQEREDYDDLLRHPGWLRFVSEVQRQQAALLEQHVNATVSERDDAQALNLLRQVVAVRNTLAWLLKLPQEKAKAIPPESMANAMSLSRRGGL